MMDKPLCNCQSFGLPERESNRQVEVGCLQMLCEGHCIARCLRGSGGGVWPHDARAVTKYRDGILAHAGRAKIVNHLDEWFRRRVNKLGEDGRQVLFSALPHGGDVALLNLACGNRGTVCSAIS